MNCAYFLLRDIEHGNRGPTALLFMGLIAVRQLSWPVITTGWSILFRRAHCFGDHGSIKQTNKRNHHVIFLINRVWIDACIVNANKHFNAIVRSSSVCSWYLNLPNVPLNKNGLDTELSWGWVYRSELYGPTCHCVDSRPDHYWQYVEQVRTIEHVTLKCTLTLLHHNRKFCYPPRRAPSSGRHMNE